MIDGFYFRRCSCLVLVALGFGCGMVSGQIQNGDFSQGLAGWVAEDVAEGGVTSAPSTGIQAVDGAARLATETGPASRRVLRQAFVFPTNSLQLCGRALFRRMLTDGADASGLPDFLQVAYLDAGGAAFDLPLLAWNVQGAYDPATFGTPAHISSSNGWACFAWDVAATHRGRNGSLRIELCDDFDGYFSEAFVDDLRVTVPSAPLETNVLARPFTQAWTLSRQTGMLDGQARFSNTGGSAAAAVGPFLLLLRADGDTRFAQPTGTRPDGRQYLDLTAAVNALLGDGRLDPGETVTVPDIELYRRYRTAPPDELFDIEAQFVP